MKKIIIAAIFATLMLGGCMCTDESATVKTLRSAGYTEIRTTGYEWFECSDDDTYHTGFIAKNPQGQQVSGTVCCGLLAKGCTIRF